MPGSWATAPALALARQGLVGVSDAQGRIYAIGGVNNNTYLTDCTRFDPSANAWSSLGALPFPRAYFAGARIGNVLYVVGGFAGSGSGQGEIYAFDPTVGSWVARGGLQQLRYFHGVAAAGGKLYTFGGIANQVLNSAEVYDPTGPSSSFIQPLPGGARQGVVGASDAQGRVYAIGGYANNAFLNRVERYDPSTGQWATVAPLNTARQVASAATDSKGRIWVFGGENASTLSSIEIYDVSANTWTAYSPALPTARSVAAGAFDGSFRLYSYGGISNSVDRLTDNSAPGAATLTTPTTGSSVDRTQPITLAWVFNDPDAGDSQSKSDIRYKLTSASTWTTILGATTTATSYALPVNQAAGNYEWQVLTYDSQGVASPWSSSSFFTAADPPGVPVITAPANGGTIATAQYTVTWSAPSQDAYEVRRVADNAGSPNTGTVYSTTGTVEDNSSRARTLTFDTNNRTEHVQVRVRYSGIWSQWASARVLVSYTPPATPVVVLTPQDATASILVAITNPAPSGNQPTVASHDILIDDGFGEGFTRRVTGWAPGAAFTYWLPVSGRAYEGNIRVVAVATNGTTSTGVAT